MNRTKKTAALLLSLIMLLSAFTFGINAAVNNPTGTDKAVTEPIKVNGRDTGVSLTQISLKSGTVYANSAPGILNVIEIDPDNEDVAIKMLNCGNYTWSKSTMGTAALKYNSSSEGTVIAAMNGDPWIVYHSDYDGDGIAATGPGVKHVSVSRGLLIIDREIWATAQISDENWLAREDNVERGTPSGMQVIFGVKDDGTGVIGIPNIAITISASGGTVIADGINRLPAPNSTIIYNQRCGTESFAFEDAYEIYLECDDTAFEFDKAIKGKVTHIFESGDTSERPAITENTVVISARGDAISKNQNKYTVGEEITIAAKVRGDKAYLSAASDWSSVEQATGGFYTLIEKGVHKGQELSTNYPCTIAGIKQDGTIMLISTTTQADGSRAACKMKNMQELVQELGCYTAVMFDGGGSTQFITLDGGEYVRRSATSDGANSVRSVISGVALVYKGADITVKNSESLGIKFLSGLGLNSTYGQQEDTDTGGAHIKAGPSYSYYYVGNVSHINGKGVAGSDTPYTELIGMRDPGYNSSWAAEQKQAAILPAAVDGAYLSLDDCKITISGYAFANGSQKNILWSVDKESWYKVEGGTFSDASGELVNLVMANGWIKTASGTHAVFENVGADLSEYKGKTVDVHFAVTPGADDKALHFLTVKGVYVGAKAAPETEEPETEPPVTGAPETEETATDTAPATDTHAETDIPPADGTLPVTDTSEAGTEASAEGEPGEAEESTTAEGETAPWEGGTDTSDSEKDGEKNGSIIYIIIIAAALVAVAAAVVIVIKKRK